MTITDPARARVLVEGPPGGGKGYVAVWRGEGEVVALGQSLWWHWVGTGGAEAGKGRLLRNLLEKKRD